MLIIDVVHGFTLKKEGFLLLGISLDASHLKKTAVQMERVLSFN